MAGFSGTYGENLDTLKSQSIEQGDFFGFWVTSSWKKLGSTCWKKLVLLLSLDAQ
jgi:hypothetical protein